ncbi:glycosyl transferase family 2 [Alteribacter lacisalsi]|uniref:Glycosyl transferase family 2 n=1 Tax=Alteribacter lacisalsi TaxID=2045244 RepID=A0A2W0H5I0_9BACI|nr:glycosyltransferase family 2 protein [Alteribacter lacisalsi]PYZ95876.1 glycosyl transferase family 2 [Alteribacter lacisalsi]
MKQQKIELLSIVIPAYNEETVLERFHEEVTGILRSLSIRYELIFVNDGSSDGTLEKLKQLKAADASVSFIDLSRNFGKESAMKAGLDHVAGDAAIVMDSDLEHPPSLIPDMVAAYREGYDVIHARSSVRVGQSRARHLLSGSFYSMMNRLAGDEVQFADGDKDFVLLSRKALDSVLQLSEYNRFSKGLFKWIGYPSKTVYFEQGTREEGASKWKLTSLITYSIDAITSFSLVPLRFSSYLGLLVSFFAFIYMLVIIGQTVFLGNQVAGFPTLVTLVLFMSGVILISLGIIGEYVARIFLEVKGRPIYFVNEYVPSEHEAQQNAEGDDRDERAHDETDQ